MERFLTDNAALEARGPIDVVALVKGTLPDHTPGLGPRLLVTRDMVAYCNGKYDPDNELLNDP